jgi:hypothetical protein
MKPIPAVDSYSKTIMLWTGGVLSNQSKDLSLQGEPRTHTHTHVVRHTYKLTHTALSVMDSPRGRVADSFYRRRSDYSCNSSKAAHFHTVLFPPLDSPLLSPLVARPSSATGLLTVCCS